MIVQCQFRSGDTRTCGYVEVDPRLHIGVQVRFKKEDQWWTVTQMGKPRQRGWEGRSFKNNI